MNLFLKWSISTKNEDAQLTSISYKNMIESGHYTSSASSILLI